MGLLADALTAYLAGAGIGLTEAGNLFDGGLPEAPPDCVTVIENGGAPPVNTFGSTSPRAPLVRLPQIRVESRGTTSPIARTNIENVYQKLNALTGQTLSNVAILWCTPIQEIRKKGRDFNERHIFECAFTLKTRDA
jgi:hypothetical protein